MPDVAHYDDGAVRYRGFQLDGEMHGDWEFLGRDGSVMRAGPFERGRRSACGAHSIAPGTS